MPTRGTFYVAPVAPHHHLSFPCWMRWERKEEGEEKERREGAGTACSVGEGTHLLEQVQLPAAVSLGPPKCVHCHLLSMRLTACQNKKPDRKSQKEYLEGRVLAAEIAGALNWLQSAVDKTIAIVTLAQVTSNIISIFLKDYSEKWRELHNNLSSLTIS